MCRFEYNHFLVDCKLHINIILKIVQKPKILKTLDIILEIHQMFSVDARFSLNAGPSRARPGPVKPIHNSMQNLDFLTGLLHNFWPFSGPQPCFNSGPENNNGPKFWNFLFFIFRPNLIAWLPSPLRSPGPWNCHAFHALSPDLTQCWFWANIFYQYKLTTSLKWLSKMMLIVHSQPRNGCN
jgi:hypothetical protein